MLACVALMGSIFLTGGDGAVLVNPGHIAEYRTSDCGRHYSKEQCLEGIDGSVRWVWKLPEAWFNIFPALKDEDFRTSPVSVELTGDVSS